MTPMQLYSKNFMVGCRTLYAAIGGTQFYSVDIYRAKSVSENSKDVSKYIVSYKFTFKDMFGSDFYDINGNSLKASVPALNKMFKLQHYYSGYRPFPTKLTIVKAYTYVD